MIQDLANLYLLKMNDLLLYYKAHKHF